MWSDAALTGSLTHRPTPPWMVRNDKQRVNLPATFTLLCCKLPAEILIPQHSMAFIDRILTSCASY